MKIKLFLFKVGDKLSYYPKLVKARYYAKKVLIDFDENWFKGKRVAVIGGSDSVLNEPLGNYIDGFDVVVRINKGVEVIEKQKEFVGTRTDVLFHCFYDIEPELGGSPVTPKLWRAYNVKSLIFSLNYKYQTYNLQNFLSFSKKTNLKYKFSQVTDALYFKNMKVVHPAGPTTGFIAINTIFNCLPKELYITGITFFKTAHNSSYREISKDTLKTILNVNRNHSVDQEYEYVKDIYLKNPDIINPDKTLRKIFETN